MKTYDFARAHVIGGDNTVYVWFVNKDFEVSDEFSITVKDGQHTFEAIKDEIVAKGYKPLLMDFKRDLNGNEDYKIELEVDLSV